MPHMYERNKITATQIRSLQDGNANWIKNTANARFSARYRGHLKKRRALPVYSQLENLLRVMQGKNQVVVLSSDTGSGKTTQVTQVAVINDFRELRKGGLRVVCTQPRVVAATESAERVAEELDVTLGQEVGYRVKNNSKVTKGVTLLEFVTDGILLNELMSSQTVPQYTTIIIDEVHERTLNTDTILLLLKDVLKRRADLKVVIMSATLDAERFATYFPGSQRIHISGKLHEVKVAYMEKPVVDYVDCAANIVGEVHFNIAPREDAQQQSIGHILVFLTGTEEIAQACDLIRKVAKDLLVLPMHAAQSQAQNRLVFQETKERKCIVSTNVAETSITIPGVAYVVDCGLVKRGMYNPRCGMEMLDTVLISEASANQRKGRAGRTRPGTCFRLYTKETFLGFPKSSMPGIHTEDLMTIVLKLRASGRDNIMALDWLEPPPIENVLRASNLLWHYGFLDEVRRINIAGTSAAAFPCDPVWYRVICKAHNLGVSKALTYTAALSTLQNDIFDRPITHHHAFELVKKGFTHPLSDHLTDLNAVRGYQLATEERKEDMGSWCLTMFLNRKSLDIVLETQRQVEAYMAKALGEPLMSIPTLDPRFQVNFRRALAEGLHTRAAMLIDSRDAAYQPVYYHYAALAESSSIMFAQSMAAQWVVFNKVHLSSKPVLCKLTAINPEWILDMPLFSDQSMSSRVAHKIMMPNVQSAILEIRRRIRGGAGSETA